MVFFVTQHFGTCLCYFTIFRLVEFCYTLQGCVSIVSVVKYTRTGSRWYCSFKTYLGIRLK